VDDSPVLEKATITGLQTSFPESWKSIQAKYSKI
jgi:hypothetical protein